MKEAIEFGPFRLEDNIVYGGTNQPFEIPEQAIKVLKVFLGHALKHGSTVLSSEEIRKRAWHGRIVDKNNLHQQIIRLRKELGADAIVSTSGPRGYQFMLPVRWSGQLPAIRWHAISVLPFVCAPGYFRDEERLRIAGYHLAFGIIHRLINTTTLEIREISFEHLRPGCRPDVAKIAYTQRADLVLAGHLTAGKQADELRAQLIESDTSNVLWSGRFDVNTADSTAIEQEIGRQIAERLGFNLEPECAQRCVNSYHPEAVARYRKGRYLWGSDHAIAKEAFDEFIYAVSLDPTYAEPWSGIADIWIVRCTFGLSEYSPNEGMAKALAAVNRALELDPHCGSAHTTRGFIAYLWEWNWDLAEYHFKRGIQDDPDYVTGQIQYARFLAAQGRFVEANLQAEKGLGLGPHLDYGVAMVAWIFYFTGQYERAKALYREIISRAPRFSVSWAMQAFVLERLEELDEALDTALTAIKLGENLITLGTLGLIRGRLGHRAEAEQVLHQLVERRKQHYVSPYHEAVVHTGLNNRREALHYLQKAVEERSEWIPHLPVDHRLRSLRIADEFQQILSQVGFKA